MAEIGPVCKIDDLGRVVIPEEFRKTFNWPIGMEVEISAADGKVIVAKHSTACVFCGKPIRVQIGERHICPACTAKYQAQFDLMSYHLHITKSSVFQWNTQTKRRTIDDLSAF